MDFDYSGVDFAGVDVSAENNIHDVGDARDTVEDIEKDEEGLQVENHAHDPPVAQSELLRTESDLAVAQEAKKVQQKEVDHQALMHVTDVDDLDQQEYLTPDNEEAYGVEDETDTQTYRDDVETLLKSKPKHYYTAHKAPRVRKIVTLLFFDTENRNLVDKLINPESEQGTDGQQQPVTQHTEVQSRVGEVVGLVKDIQAIDQINDATTKRDSASTTLAPPSIVAPGTKQHDPIEDDTLAPLNDDTAAPDDVIGNKPKREFIKADWCLSDDPYEPGSARLSTWQGPDLDDFDDMPVPPTSTLGPLGGKKRKRHGISNSGGEDDAASGTRLSRNAKRNKASKLKAKNAPTYEIKTWHLNTNNNQTPAAHEFVKCGEGKTLDVEKAATYEAVKTIVTRTLKKFGHAIRNPCYFVNHEEISSRAKRSKRSRTVEEQVDLFLANTKAHGTGGVLNVFAWPGEQEDVAKQAFDSWSEQQGQILGQCTSEDSLRDIAVK